MPVNTKRTFWFEHNFYGIQLSVEAERHEWEIGGELTEHFTVSTVLLQDGETLVNHWDMPAIVRYEPDPFFGERIKHAVYGTLNDRLAARAREVWIAQEKAETEDEVF